MAEMALTTPNEKSSLHLLEERFVAGVGFPSRPGGGIRPDATCWAILALEAAGGNADLVEQARRLLARTQAEDGRVCLSPQHMNACWPTPLAVLAWHGAPAYDEPRNRALRFLREVDQTGVVDGPQIGEAHDVEIHGWPWVARTHAWVEPTAYSLLALEVGGSRAHPWAQDAVRLLLDRQLADGGWNVGTTVTFGVQMWPTPEATGLALQALAGLAPRPAVARSIAYLRSQLPLLHAPMSLSWAILGLHAWQETLDRPQEQIRQALARQEQLGPYDTFCLGLLLLASHCPAGLVRFLEDKGQTTT